MPIPSTLFAIAEGWTAPLDAQLLLDDAAFDATGMTVTSIVRDNDGRLIAVATDWTTIASSIVRLSPILGDFRAGKGPYTVRFKVVDGSGQVAYFPPAEPDLITVAAV